MNIPKNGKVIVLDNVFKEAEPLLQILSKNRIPHTYYSGELEHLPEKGNLYEDVRIVFLDINLTGQEVYETIISQLGGTLKRIIKPYTPYIAAIWSNNESDNEDLVKELFETREPQIAPISIVYLNKSDYFLFEADHGYTLDSDPEVLNKIETKINDSLDGVDAIKMLIDWENLIHLASTNTVLGFSGIIDYDKYWNNNLKHVLYKLAHAQLGKTIFDQSEEEIQRATLKTLTNSFNDQVEKEISTSLIEPDLDISTEGQHFLRTIEGSDVKLSWIELVYHLYINNTHKSKNKKFEKLKANNNTQEKEIAKSLKSHYKLISPKLNAELLISKSPEKDFRPGSVYSILVTGSKKRKLLKTYFPRVMNKTAASFDISDLSGFKFIELECTPICDYSQIKMLRYRFLPGILYYEEHHNILESNLDSFYREIPPFFFNDAIYRMVFDYRLFKSVNKEDAISVSNNNFLFSLKKELLVDIQTKLSSHINRPGLVTIS